MYSTPDLTAPDLAPRQGAAAGIRRRLATVLARPAEQQPEWPEPEFAAAMRMLLAQAPPVVDAPDVDALGRTLASAATGEAFVLHGGDCAETFAGNTAEHVRGNVGTLLRMADWLRGEAGMPVITIGRLAGQYAKPRSDRTDSSGLPVYRGDMVNSAEPSPIHRVHDPARLLSAYANAISTVNVVRDMTGPLAEDVYTSHEALVLDYERALSRIDTSSGQPRLLDLSAHFLWIGERTRQLGGAQLGLAELIGNPVGVKLGPGTTPELAVQYAQRLDPGRVPGRLTLISRMGSKRIRDVLPGIVRAVTATGRQVVWQCDPMHGNTYRGADGRKTRDFDQIIDEVRGFFEVHRALGSHPGGLHLEFTGDDVTECVGGSPGIGHEDLGARYHTACDPRLNGQQALQVGATVAELLRR